MRTPAVVLGVALGLALTAGLAITQDFGDRIGVAVTLPAPGPTTLTVTPTTVVPGGTVTVTWSGIPAPTPTDGVGLYLPGAPASAWLEWAYVGTCTRQPGSVAVPAGSCPLSNSYRTPDGAYELRLLSQGGSVPLVTIPLIIGSPAPVPTPTPTPAPPPPPPPVVVTPPSDVVLWGRTVVSLVVVTWRDRSADETGFQIQRRRAPGDLWVAAGTVEPAVQGWLDWTPQVPGQTVCYRVVAVRGEVASLPSKVSCRTTPRS